MLHSSEPVLLSHSTEMRTWIGKLNDLAHNSVALRAPLAWNDPDSLTTSKARRAATTWDLQGELVPVCVFGELRSAAGR